MSVYPLGYPVVAAAFLAIAGPLAVFVVAPLAAGLLAWCTFVVARQLAGPIAGLLAALLIATTPVTLLHAVDAMGDVPAAACWLLAWLMALGHGRGAAAAAGAATAVAVMIRPNLAPLGAIAGLLILFDGSAPSRWRWKNAALFLALAAVGPVIVGWSQYVLYGSPLTPGYVEWRGFFRIAHIAPNLELYPRLLWRLHTPLLFAGFAGVWLFRQSRVAWSACAMIALNFAIYLPYLSLDDWPFLRFLLPGLAALFVLFAATLVHIGMSVGRWSRWLTPLALIPAVLVLMQAMPQVRYSLNEWRAHTRVRLMGHYLHEVLPANAAVLSFMHSGAVAHYTARQIVRLDLLEPATLDQVIDQLRGHGYHPVLVLDEALEGEAFRARFPQSRYGRLDWRPRATFTTIGRIWYLDLADRDHAARVGTDAVTD
ncbi:MAG TPA: glycosyltransferase family 39 protein [Vicinamibacterales bacterium]|nr:glycosyltransferase family 39 protein [Vicinamibacterales bacterium]